MAAPTIPLVPVDEYLNSTFHPDREYVDGVLRERNVGTLAHGILQSLLVLHFGGYRKQFGFVIATEARMTIVPRSRYRIPDVMLVAAPASQGKVVDKAPLAVFEVLSPDDRMQDLLGRFGEYAGFGVQEIVLLDPQARLAYRFEAGGLREVEFKTLAIAGRDVPFDSVELFREFAAAYEG